MKQLFQITFWIATLESRGRILCHVALLASGYDDAVQQCTEIYGKYERFSIERVEPKGTPIERQLNSITKEIN